MAAKVPPPSGPAGGLQPGRIGGGSTSTSTLQAGRPSAIIRASEVILGSSNDLRSSTGSKVALISDGSLVSKGPPCYVIGAQYIIENRAFTLLAALLTVYALFGDDMRIIFTDKPMDNVFDTMVCVCISVFVIEIMASSFGKPDYFNGFFFWLDLISTVTLLLDITAVSVWVYESLGSGDMGDGGQDMRSGRTARVGARAGRVVRVLRMVRIIKLYKAYFEAKRKKPKKQLSNNLSRSNSNFNNVKGPGEEDDWDDDDYAAEEEAQEEIAEESRVGKRLSDVTTRRTICLILAMLLVLPNLQAEVVDQTAFSTEYGADHVFGAFKKYVSGNASRFEYEHALLQYVYYHNWFAGEDDNYCPNTNKACAGEFYGHLFWIGIMGRDEVAVEAMSSNAQLTEPTVAGWEDSYHNDGIYSYGTMPPVARSVLHSPWTTNCDTETFRRRGISLLSKKVDGLVTDPISCPEGLRFLEAQRFSPRLLDMESYKDWHITFYFDVRKFVRMDSVFGLLVTFAVLILLIVGSLLFSKDANRLVLHPVENMIAKVQIIRSNPIYAMKMADEAFKNEQITLSRAKKRRERDQLLALCETLISCRCLGSSQSDEPMETVILEKSIIKLGSLLALGLGEAGANIISHNMKGDGSAGVDAMVPGTCVECIIGVARILHFSTATEVLQEKIMTFVNQIAEIVHGVANEFHGAPNKNNGDMFLVIWRHTGLSTDVRARRLAELSVLAFSKILGALHRSPLLAEYRTHPGLQHRLVRLGKHNCRVNLTFGLHAGWAIEGAVGSEYKIDASYLSPNVSLATTVEHTTRVYGVSLVLSESVVELCSRGLADNFRLMDRVRMRGSPKPVSLYCVDLDYRRIPVDRFEPLQLTWTTRNRFKARQFLETEKHNKLRPEYDVAEAFRSDRAIDAMRRGFTVEFFQLFNMGYQNYAQGEWQVARRMLNCTRKLLGEESEDGPSTALLKFMEAHGRFEAPKDWQGIRDIDTHS